MGATAIDLQLVQPILDSPNREEFLRLQRNVSALLKRILDRSTNQHWISVESAGLFVAGWHNLGGTATPAAFYKDPTGRVYLRGTVVGTGAAPTKVFTLPQDAAPAHDLRFSVTANSAFGEVRVLGTLGAEGGAVYLNTGSTAAVSLDGISFITGV